MAVPDQSPIPAAFANARVRFWVCPVPGHGSRNDENGGPVVTVEWRDAIAYCTAADCGRSSADLRPVYEDPGDIIGEFAEVGWSLSWGCRLTFGCDGDQMRVTVSMSDRDLANAGTIRSVTREQVADYARKLLALAEGGPSA